MYSVSSSVGSGDITQHVEVNAITACNFGLTAVEELRVGDMTLSSVDTLTHDDQMSTISSFFRDIIASNLDVSGQKTNLGLHG